MQEIMTIDPALRAAALDSKAWPYEEARKLLQLIGLPFRSN